MRIFRNPVVLVGVILAVVVVLWIVDEAMHRPSEVSVHRPVRADETPQFRPTEGTAAWWCLEDEPCWRDRGACDVVRRRDFDSGRRDRRCIGADAVACLTTVRVLDKRQTKDCYVSIAACMGRVTSLRFSEPDDVKVVAECVPE